MKCCRTGTRAAANQAAAGPVGAFGRGTRNAGDPYVRWGAGMTTGVGIWMGIGWGSALPTLHLDRLVWAAGTARDPAAGANGPLEELRRAELALETTVHRRLPEWSPEADATRLRVGAILAGIIDYERIAKSALASDWDKLTDEQRRSFLDRFTLLTNQAFTAALLRSD